MNIVKDISKEQATELAKVIREKFYSSRTNFKISIFLCGADIHDNSKIRFQLAKYFSDWWNSYQFDLVYPEDIFEELLYNSNGKDLLSLENILAESIDVIVIIPESPGSFAELGAFANNINLNSKIICLLDNKYRKHKSFINQGPIKIIKKANPKGILYYDSINLGGCIPNLQSAIRDTVRNMPIERTDSINLLQIDNFLLPTIYLLEPVLKETLVNCVESVTEDKANAYQTTAIALTIMSKKKFIELTTFGYKLTKLGISHYFGLRQISGRIKIPEETNDLDNIRLEILNFRLRKKKLKI